MGADGTVSYQIQGDASSLSGATGKATADLKKVNEEVAKLDSNNVKATTSGNNLATAERNIGTSATTAATAVQVLTKATDVASAAHTKAAREATTLTTETRSLRQQIEDTVGAQKASANASDLMTKGLTAAAIAGTAILSGLLLVKGAITSLADAEERAAKATKDDTLIKETLNAKIKELKGSWDNLLVAFGKPVLSPLKDLVDEISTGIQGMTQDAADFSAALIQSQKDGKLGEFVGASLEIAFAQAGNYLVATLKMVAQQFGKDIALALLKLTNPASLTIEIGKALTGGGETTTGGVPDVFGAGAKAEALRGRFKTGTREQGMFDQPLGPGGETPFAINRLPGAAAAGVLDPATRRNGIADSFTTTTQGVGGASANGTRTGGRDEADGTQTAILNELKRIRTQ